MTLAFLALLGAPYVYDISSLRVNKTCVLYQIPLSNTNVVNYGMLAIHESNAPFPVTRH